MDPMGSKKVDNPVVQWNFRIPEEWLHQADELAIALSRPGLELTRTDVTRMALARGLQDMLAEVKDAKRKK